MVKLKDSSYQLPDGTIDLDLWLQEIAPHYPESELKIIRSACLLTQFTDEQFEHVGLASCLQQGLAMAEILLAFNVDYETIAAAIVHGGVQYNELSLDEISQHLGKRIARLIMGVAKMDAIRTIYGDMRAQNKGQVENLRQMLIAMIEDVRVALIKLAERCYLLRSAKQLPEAERHFIAAETKEIYAPLANRLGVNQLKWELEDLAFRAEYPDVYVEIAQKLGMRRIEREQHIKDLIAKLQSNLHESLITNAQIQGRAKHIYSIYRKMQRKNAPFEKIFDTTALRILVLSVKDCYTALSAVHDLWQQIPQEFDDYIAHPKKNGYQSIHTAVMEPNGHSFEVQIRTLEMHRLSEHGVAAHWAYKEGSATKGVKTPDKLAWLRQVMDWQKEVARGESLPDELQAQVFDERVYVFTPAGAVIDLPQGATPVDFAYHIHSEIGHRCRGAKVNQQLVPLTYSLKTGEQVEIITSKYPSPSRDWLNPQLGYLKSSRARAKLHHWLREQDFDKNLAAGQTNLERELRRLHLEDAKVAPHLDEIAARFNCGTAKDLYAAIGAGDLQVQQVLTSLQARLNTHIKPEIEIPSHPPKISGAIKKRKPGEIFIAGVDNLLTHIAQCCKPIPGDPVIGMVTQLRGVSLHLPTCKNIRHMEATQPYRLIPVSWGEDTHSQYAVDLHIQAHQHHELVKDITHTLAAQKITILGLHTALQKSEQSASINLTIEVKDIDVLDGLMQQLRQIPHVKEVHRHNIGL